MSNKEQNQNQVQRCSGSAAGEPVLPEEQQPPEKEIDEGAEAVVQDIPEVQEISIGFPVPPGEVERLKREAERPEEEEHPEESVQDVTSDSQPDNEECGEQEPSSSASG